MSVKVDVYEVGSLREAVRIFRRGVQAVYRRQWSKTRPGAYEKPSYRRRKAESLRQRNVRWFRWVRRRVRKNWRKAPRFTVYLGLSSLFRREEVYQHARPTQRKPRYIPADHADDQQRPHRERVRKARDHRLRKLSMRAETIYDTLRAEF